MKPSEISLRGAEFSRKKAFEALPTNWYTADDFLPGKEVFYKKDGRWQRDVLSSKIKEKEGKFYVKVGSNAPEELVEPPLPVKFKPGDVFRYNGKEYTIGSEQNDRPWLDTKNTISYALRSSKDQRDRIVLSQPALEKIKIENEKTGSVETAQKSIEEAGVELTNRMQRMVEQARKVRGEARGKLHEGILDVSQRLKKLSEDFAQARSAGAIEELKELEKQAKKLPRDLEDTVDDLDRAIASALAEQDKKLSPEEAAQRNKEAAAFESKVNRELLFAQGKRNKEIEAWTAEKEQKEKEIEEKKLEIQDAKKVKDNQPTVLNLEKEKKDLDKELLKFIKSKPDQNLSDDEIKAVRAAVYKQLPSGLLKGAVESAATEDVILSQIKSELGRVGPSSEQGKLLQADEAAAISGIVETIVQEWKQKPEEAKAFDFQAEYTLLKEKLAELTARVDVLGNEDLAKQLRAIKDGKKSSNVPLNQLTAETPDVEEKIGDFFKAIIETEMEVTKAELNKKEPVAEAKEEGIKESELPEAEQKESEGTILDLPPQLWNEILAGSAGDIYKVMETVAVQGGEEEGDKGKIQTAFQFFLRSLREVDLDSGTPSLRRRLKEAGVDDWQEFVKRFDSELGQKTAELLLNFGKSQVSNKTAGLWLKMKKMGWVGTGKFLLTVGIVGFPSAAYALGSRLVPAPKALKTVAGRAIGGGLLGGLTGGARLLAAKLTGIKFFVEKTEQAKLAAEQENKKRVIDEAAGQWFEKIDPENSNRKKFKKDKQKELSYILSALVNEASVAVAKEKEPEKKFVVKDENGDNAIELQGQDVITFYRMLDKASKDPSLQVDEQQELRMRFEYAKVLAALRNNSQPNEATTGALKPPLARAAGWILETYLGRGKGKLQKAGTVATYAALGAAAGTWGSKYSEIVATFMGGSAGMAIGVKGVEKIQTWMAERRAKKETRELLNFAEQVLSGNERTPKEFREWGTLLTAIFSKRLVEIKDFSSLNRSPQRALVEDAIKHLSDYHAYLQKDVNLRMQWQDVQSRLITKANFREALDSLGELGRREEAKNAKIVEVGRSAARVLGGIAGGVAGAWAGYEATKALQEHLAAHQPKTTVEAKSATKAVVPASVAPKGAPHPMEQAAPTPPAALKAYTLHGNPYEQLKVDVARHSMHAGDTVRTRVAENMDTVARDLEKIAKGHGLKLETLPGGKGTGLGVAQTKELASLMHHHSEIFSVTKDGVVVHDPTKFTEMEKLLMQHANHIHPTEQWGYGQVATENWKPIEEGANVHIDFKNVHAAPAVHGGHPRIPHGAGGVEPNDVAAAHPTGVEEVIHLGKPGAAGRAATQLSSTRSSPLFNEDISNLNKSFKSSTFGPVGGASKPVEGALATGAKPPVVKPPTPAQSWFQRQAQIDKSFLRQHGGSVGEKGAGGLVVDNPAKHAMMIGGHHFTLDKSYAVHQSTGGMVVVDKVPGQSGPIDLKPALRNGKPVMVGYELTTSGKLSPNGKIFPLDSAGYLLKPVPDLSAGHPFYVSPEQTAGKVDVSVFNKSDPLHPYSFKSPVGKFGVLPTDNNKVYLNLPRQALIGKLVARKNGSILFVQSGRHGATYQVEKNGDVKLVPEK